MRFKDPEIGTCIWKKKFAIFPKRISNTKVWFEYYYTCSIFHEGFYGSVGHWTRWNFLPESKEVQDYLLTLSPLAKSMSEE